MNHEFETLRLTIEQGVARLTLINGAKGNPLGRTLGRELRDAAIILDETPGLRVVILTAEGKNFCVGGDLTVFAAEENLSAAVKTMTADYHAALSKLLRMDAPIITAVQGACAGAGVALAALGDIVVASASSHFTIAYTAIGFSPDGASTFILPRLIGLRRFQELVLTNRRIAATEAAAIGLVTEIAEDDALAARGEELAQVVAAGPTRAFAATRRLLLETFGASPEAQMEWEARLLSEQCRTDDVREGVSAALARRRPHFTGR
ncbi:enoyl-CoA hydratase-related protein [Novosphingobium sp. KCTC 2891]|uniref:enoyl-CoA hydratase/isomerase family protein n=1 Tax=Novosphingobium sp. KCTC 2891 TaxID=2989730 RepID=UPI002222D88A|nr:enoyl-CoA hydratase-related protein [Novosphingobium sp. KCTC 2891]MCW1381495.1 enoyl-CoA hydratase-related protein [Novosphingobium sp. KCTC 2891]